MKEIQLTQGKVALVDDEDFEILNQFKWCAIFDGYNWYASRATHRHNGKQKHIRMHREIINAPQCASVDHRNGDGLDNRRENLRLCTHHQNTCNRKSANKNNKLGIKGVCWREDIKKFQAKIIADGKQIHLGYYNVLGDADSAYRIAEEKYFGEFARAI